MPMTAMPGKGVQEGLVPMAAADRDLPAQDHYQVLGVTYDASSGEITQAWRRQARAEHPDHRPPEASTAAARRFRALAEAYRVLGDPARRAAYDRTLASAAGPPAPPPRPKPAPRPAPPVRPAAPPLWAGPVHIEAGPVHIEGDPVHVQAGPAHVEAGPVRAGPDDDWVREALLAALARRLLGRAWEEPW
jgi:hypothetical protein